MARSNVWGAFRALELEFDRRREPYDLLFDEEKLRESPGFEELCSMTFPGPAVGPATYYSIRLDHQA
jgi:hypothetical protein